MRYAETYMDTESEVFQAVAALGGFVAQQPMLPQGTIAVEEAKAPGDLIYTFPAGAVVTLFSGDMTHFEIVSGALRVRVSSGLDVDVVKIWDLRFRVEGYGQVEWITISFNTGPTTFFKIADTFWAHSLKEQTSVNPLVPIHGGSLPLTAAQTPPTIDADDMIDLNNIDYTSATAQIGTGVDKLLGLQVTTIDNVPPPTWLVAAYADYTGWTTNSTELFSVGGATRIELNRSATEYRAQVVSAVTTSVGVPHASFPLGRGIVWVMGYVADGVNRVAFGRNLTVLGDVASVNTGFLRIGLNMSVGASYNDTPAALAGRYGGGIVQQDQSGEMTYASVLDPTTGNIKQIMDHFGVAV